MSFSPIFEFEFGAQQAMTTFQKREIIINPLQTGKV